MTHDDNDEQPELELTAGWKSFSLKARSDSASGLKIAVSIAIVVLSVGVAGAGIFVAYLLAVK